MLWFNGGLLAFDQTVQRCPSPAADNLGLQPITYWRSACIGVVSPSLTDRLALLQGFNRNSASLKRFN